MDRELKTPKYIIITGNILLDKRLTDKQRLLLALIDTLSNSKGYCFADNAYIADVLDCNKDTVSHNISEIKNLGYLTVEIIMEGEKFKERRIFVEKNMGIQYLVKDEQIQKNDSTPYPNSGIPLPKNGYTPTQKRVGIVIDKLIDKEYNDRFDEFWDSYDYKEGKQKARIAWLNLSEKEKTLALKLIPIYKECKPNLKYRKLPEGFIHNKYWNDEVYAELMNHRIPETKRSTEW